MSEPRAGQYDVEAVKRRLPHRYPFLMVDRIEESGPGYAIGVKNVTVNEPCFQGHFPQRSILPGALIAEALMQTAAFVGRPEGSSDVGGGGPDGSPAGDPGTHPAGDPGAGPDGGSAGGRDGGRDGAEPAAPDGIGRQFFCVGMNLKFSKPVVPGDRLYLDVRLTRRLGDMVRIRGSARTAAGIVASGDLSLAAVEQGE